MAHLESQHGSGEHAHDGDHLEAGAVGDLDAGLGGGSGIALLGGGDDDGGGGSGTLAVP